MRLVLHPQVRSDVEKIMDHYEEMAAAKLADQFYQEFRRSLADAVSRPTSFAVRERGLRRVNLRRFPYHFLFRIADDVVRVLVVRHHRRHPSVGIARR